ncbi:hypothetical protein KQI63_15030 [bacterium]|nr:hypothetical protein [bacterium]
MMRRLRLLLSVALLVTTLPAVAASLDDLDFRGYVRETALFWKLPAYLSTSGAEEQQFTNLLHTRQNLRWYANMELTFGFELKTRLFSGDAVQAMLAQTEQLGGNQSLFNWERRFVDENNQLLVSGIDRAWADYFLGDWQVTVGRQRIAWGSTMVWNPTDIFNPSSPIDFDNEEKPGSDGIRVQRYLGTNSKLELAYASTDLEDSDASTVAGRVLINAFDFDWNVLLGMKEGNTMFGGGFEGDILGGGFRGEVLYRVHQQEEEAPDGAPPSPRDLPSYIRFAIDGDYTFTNSLYLHAGVRYNELGATKDAGSLTNQFKSFENQWLSPARWSLFGQVGGNATPLMRLDLMAIVNPQDGSFYIGPSGSYSLITNLDLILTGLVFQGEDGTEFGAQGTILMGRLKYSF